MSMSLCTGYMNQCEYLSESEYTRPSGFCTETLPKYKTKNHLFDLSFNIAFGFFSLSDLVHYPFLSSHGRCCWEQVVMFGGQNSSLIYFVNS